MSLNIGVGVGLMKINNFAKFLFGAVLIPSDSTRMENQGYRNLNRVRESDPHRIPCGRI